MTAAGTTDVQLLESYSQSGDRAALGELVRRYIDLVYSASLRQVGDARLAREVTRAVFFILTHQKRSIPKSEPLACWLYRATRCAAVNALKLEIRRRKRNPSVEPDENPADLPAWDPISTHLDAAIAALNEMDRITLILHYFQHDVLGTVAAALRVPEPMARERLFSAVQHLREDLAAIGLSVAAADVFSSLAIHGTHRAPADLISSITTSLASGQDDADTRHLPRKTTRMMRRPSMYSVLCSVALVLFSSGLAWAILSHEQNLSRSQISGLTTAPANMYSVRLRKNDDEVWLENVESQHYANSVIGAITTSLRAEGDKITYDQAMGFSGAAFRFQIRQPEWGAASTFCIDRADDLMRALGRKLTIIDKPSESPNAQRARAAIVDSIDHMRPVLFLNTEAGLILAYRKGGKQFLYRPYGFGGDRTPLFEWNGASVGVISAPATQPTTKPDIVHRSLALAVQLSRAPQSPPDAENQTMTCGLTGLQLWIDQLAEVDRFTSYNPDKYKDTMTANAWMLSTLIDARTSAGHYLRWASTTVPESSAVHLAKAADLYDSIARTLEPARALAPFPWTIPTVEWTADMRKQQALILTEALAIEKVALTEIAAATTQPTTKP